MIANQLFKPKSILVIGGSNDIHKPGGKILKNLIDGKFAGKLFVSNPKEEQVQGIQSFKDLNDLPHVDLAIIAIAAKYTLAAIKLLTEKKETKAFIILSAGYSEESEAGAELEIQIVDQINKYNGALIGPNCTGILTPNHHSIFTEPTPKLDPKGCDFISGSGATAAFIMDAGIAKGLSFSSIFSVGNSAQLGVEDLLEHLDVAFDTENSSKVKLLYIETINKPQKLLKHAKSLIHKGCKIAAIKAGSSEAGSRAASSHTGALASPDEAVNALFQKAGIVRCYGREDLIAVASVFMHPPLKGRNLAIITHAGGPAVMLTDALSKGGLEIPPLTGEKAEVLKAKLFSGSSIANPIDFLATGTAEQLGTIIDAINNDFDEIDGMIVIFGTPGLSPIYNVYELLDKKIRTSKKPIFPVLPSTFTAAKEITFFLEKGHINFPDEVNLGNALAQVYNTSLPETEDQNFPEIDFGYIQAIIDSNEYGYRPPSAVRSLLDGAGIRRAGESTCGTSEVAVQQAERLGFPVVMKVVGPVHKSDVGGVVLNVKDAKTVENEFNRMIEIPDTVAVLIQPMLSGTELFVGAKYEDKFGHMILCGLGGIFIEVLKDVSYGLAPISYSEAQKMIKNLKSYPIIQGIRGKAGIDEDKFADIIWRLSALLQAAPEIKELDLNPLLGTSKSIIAVDARIRIEKDN
jgi:acyl-CoA synthetase (NDP forming)